MPLPLVKKQRLSNQHVQHPHATRAPASCTPMFFQLTEITNFRSCLNTLSTCTLQNFYHHKQSLYCLKLRPHFRTLLTVTCLQTSSQCLLTISEFLLEVSRLKSLEPSTRILILEHLSSVSTCSYFLISL